MRFERSVVEALVANPSEGLNDEIKSWIDPSSNAGAAKIVKAALALRNRNGGHVLIGFDDKTLRPDLGKEPVDVRGTFHVDVIQGLVTKYASESFEIAVALCERDQVEYPVIVVPSGVRTPVSAKRDLKDGTATLIRRGAVYFRTLAANGTPSTAEAGPDDWKDIVEICFDNRDADIGRFLRRHLPGLDAASFLSLITQLAQAPQLPAQPSLREKAEQVLKEGDALFRERVAAKTLTPQDQAMMSAGSYTVALVIDPPHLDMLPDRTFSTIIASSNPKYTGWPMWLETSGFSDPNSRPKRRGKAIETLILSSGGGLSKHFDFARIDPKGEFYQRRILQDDAVDKVPPKTVLDPILLIIRVAEIIAVGLAFAKALGWSAEARLGFAFCWRGLSGRELTPWANFFVNAGGGAAHEDEVGAFTEVPAGTPAVAIAPYVEQVVREVFILFDGYVMPSSAIEEWTRRLVERRLN